MKKVLLFVLGIVLMILSVIYLLNLDYSSLKSFSFEQIRFILKGLSTPEWAFIHDGSKEDLSSLLLVTVAIAFMGIIFGTIIAFPISILASSRLMNSIPFCATLFKGLLNLLRSIPTLIYAILFVRIVGPGAFAGVLALGTQMIGMLGKLFSEAFDNADDSSYETLIASAASPIQAFQYARLPQVLPLLLGYILNHFEIGIRSAAILGLVGAGGIGAPIIFALQSRNWSKVSIILLGIIVLVVLIDRLSALARRKIQ